MVLSEMRKSARESLKGKWKNAVLISLLFFGFSVVLGLISGAFKNINSLMDVVVMIISIPISFGVVISFMKLKKGEDVKFYDFFKLGFSNFARAWKIVGNLLLKLWLPILLYIIAIFAFVFLNAAAIAASIATSSSALFGLSALGLVLLIASIVFLVIASLKYVLVFFIACDNESMSAKEVVEQSNKLMKGYKGSYFLLNLSFIGWGLLSVLTFYIGLLWLFPYMQFAFICFYEYVKENSLEK